MFDFLTTAKTLPRNMNAAELKLNKFKSGVFIKRRAVLNQYPGIQQDSDGKKNTHSVVLVLWSIFLFFSFSIILAPYLKFPLSAFSCISFCHHSRFNSFNFFAFFLLLYPTLSLSLLFPPSATLVLCCSLFAKLKVISRIQGKRHVVQLFSI